MIHCCVIFFIKAENHIVDEGIKIAACDFNLASIAYDKKNIYL